MTVIAIAESTGRAAPAIGGRDRRQACFRRKRGLKCHGPEYLFRILSGQPEDGDNQVRRGETWEMQRGTDSPGAHTMHHLMETLPVFATLGVVAMLVGPLARVPIDLGAWLLDMLVRRMCEGGSRH